MELLAIALVGAAIVLTMKGGSTGGNINIRIGGSSPSPLASGQSKGSSGGGGFGGGLGGGGSGSSGGSSSARGLGSDPLADAIDNRTSDAMSNADLKAQADSESKGLTPYEQQQAYNIDSANGGMFGPEDQSGNLDSRDTGGLSSAESYGVDDWTPED